MWTILCSLVQTHISIVRKAICYTDNAYFLFQFILGWPTYHYVLNLCLIFVENSRRERERKEQRQRWVWGSIAAVLTIGTAALAWSYLPSGRGYPTYDSQVPDSDDAAN